MATYLTTQLIQTFLENTKLTVQDVNSNLESLAKNMTFGRLSARFDTTGWTGSGNTPSLVLQLMCMKYCSILYRRQYSESLEEDNNYAVYLDKLWDQILDQILSGELDVLDPGAGASSVLGPIFYPTDAATTLAETDPTNENAAPLAFTMGKVF